MFYDAMSIINKILLQFQAIRVRGGDIFAHFELYAPGAYHHARFMGKSLYLLKIFLLSNSFPLTANQSEHLTRLVGFVVHLYGRYFLSAPLAAAAPRHDLSLWYDLKEYRHFDNEIADAALASLRRHLWYLCPELVVLSMFDDHTPLEEKQEMAIALYNLPRPQVYTTGKPGQPNFDPVGVHLLDVKPSLAAFITPRSWLLFHLLESNAGWLQQDPEMWPNNAEYQFLQNFVNDLMVVNDPAERAVKDVQECAQLTRDPAHRDNVILVRSDHRGRVARLRKADLHNV